MKNWKTTLLGFLGGMAMLFGPRLNGDTTAPAITLGNAAQAAVMVLLGLAAKDHDVTGGSKVQPTVDNPPVLPPPDKPAVAPRSGV